MLAHSTWRKVAILLVGAAGFVWMYEATVLDSREEAAAFERADPTPPQPGARLRFSATAYCKGTTTASGVNVRSGIAAADPDLLPVGSVVEIDAPGSKYDGIYTVLDTGPKVKGRHLDLYMWSCHEALRFGRKSVRITVLRLGWNPQHSAPETVDSLFRQREAERAAQKAREAAAADAAATSGSENTAAQPATASPQPAPASPQQ
ncbi:MAG TPA: 3D domain-containing protein [Vicinamibacterales bacterium]